MRQTKKKRVAGNVEKQRKYTHRGKGYPQGKEEGERGKAEMDATF